MSDALSEEDLRKAMLKVDLLLKRRQAFWETPRNLAIILGVVVALVGTAAGIVGFQIGTRPPQTINVKLDAPLPTRAVP